MSVPVNASCPLGGKWYVCANAASKFLGCCTSDPCVDSNKGCTAGDLRPASFNPAAWGKFPDQQCSAGQFWTCRDTKPPFMGCCTINPCHNGSCPAEDLAGAYLSSNPAQQIPFVSQSASNISTSIGSSPSSIPSPAGSELSKGAIAGISIAAFFVVAGIVAVFGYTCFRKRNTQEPVQNTQMESYSEGPRMLPAVDLGPPTFQSYDYKFNQDPTTGHLYSPVKMAHVAAIPTYNSRYVPVLFDQQTGTITPHGDFSINETTMRSSHELESVGSFPRAELDNGIRWSQTYSASTGKSPLLNESSQNFDEPGNTSIGS